MSNLGGFAGGLAQGFQSQERLNLAQKDQADNQAMNNRRMVMAEQDQAAQQEGRDREKSMRDKSAALFKKYYGEQEEVIGETEGDDGNGGKTKIPTVRKTVRQPKMDPKVDEQWATEHQLLVAEHSGMTMEQMEKISGFVETGRKTRAGAALDLVLAGNDKGMKDFLTHIGKDPAGAKLDRRLHEGVQQIVLANGEVVDLKRAAAATATAAYYTRMLDEEKQAQGTQHNLAQTKNINAQAAGHIADAALVPAKAKLLANQAYAAGESGNLSKAKRQNVGSAGAAGAPVKAPTKDVLAAVRSVAARGSDGKSDPGSVARMLAIASHAMQTGKAKDANSAAALAQREDARMSSDADREVAEVLAAAKASPKNKELLLKRFGKLDIDTLRNASLQKMTSAYGGAPILNATEEDDE